MSEELPELPKPAIRVTAFGEIEPTDGRQFVMGDFYTADQVRQAVLLERENSPIALVERYGMWLTRLSDGAWGADIPGESGDLTVNPDPKPGEPGHVRATATGKTAAEAILNCVATIRSGLK